MSDPVPDATRVVAESPKPDEPDKPQKKVLIKLRLDNKIQGFVKARTRLPDKPQKTGTRKSSRIGSSGKVQKPGKVGGSGTTGMSGDGDVRQSGDGDVQQSGDGDVQQPGDAPQPALPQYRSGRIDAQNKYHAPVGGYSRHKQPQSYWAKVKNRLHNAQGNPPAGISQDTWAKAYNCADSALYKQGGRRKEYSAAARESGETRARAIAKLIEIGALPVDFDDTNP